jgi:WD40 repeat protein
MQSNFCYVLTSRQMGKSSLMVRTAARLREDGVHVAVLDLTSIGQNLNAEQWYDGLLARLGQQFQLEDELEEAWLANTRLSPLLRWMKAVETIVLPQRAGRIIIFVDEIDAVRSLPFSTDEFFAAIRELYNRRTEDAELERLTFCLLGVASPSDLIRDTRTTPFNIGQRIELNDFSDDEAVPLANGLGRDERTAKKLLNRILYWTGGHPYLTQRLCQATAADASVNDAAGIARLCEELFFTTRARARDDNLLFVRERLLKSEADRAALLDLYKKLRDDKRVKDDETNPLISVLRLSGITRVVEGLLYVRNRIYYRVFDREWVLANLPDAEVLRQRAAYRRGVLRTATIAAVMLAVVSGLAMLAYWQRNRAVESEEAKRKLLYVAQMNTAGQDWASGSMARLRELLNVNLPTQGQKDLRGFEWFYLWRCANTESLTVKTPQIFSLALSPDGKRLAAGDDEGHVTLWDTTTWELLRTLKGHKGTVITVAFSPDGKTVASGCFDTTFKLWDAETGQELSTVSPNAETIYSIEFSPNGERLATFTGSNAVKIWDIKTLKEVWSTPGRNSLTVPLVSFSPDGKRIVAGEDYKARLFDAATGKELREIQMPDGVSAAKYSLDGKTLVIQAGNTIKITDPETGSERRTIKVENDEKGYFVSIALSPDGKLLASSGSDNAIRVWEVDTGRELQVFKGHENHSILPLVFSRDGKKVISGSPDSTIRVWALSTGVNTERVSLHAAGIGGIAVSPDSKMIASLGKDGKVIVSNTSTGEMILSIDDRRPDYSYSIVFTPDNKRLVYINQRNTVKIVDLNSAQVIRSLDIKAVSSQMSYPWAISQDASKVVAVAEMDTCEIWEIQSGQKLTTIKGTYFVFCNFSPDGKTLATSFLDGTVKLWDVATGKELATLNGLRLPRALVFSPNGKVLATSGISGEIKLWDVETRKERFLLKGHTATPDALAFSFDGKRLASGGGDPTIRLWDVEAGQQMITLSGHSKFVSGLAFPPDGSFLASGSEDKTIRFWRAATDTEVQARRGQ